MNAQKQKGFLVLTVFLTFYLSYVQCSTDKASDDYVVSAQAECFTSKRIISCFRYKAARYLWSIANGRMNLFEHDNSRSIVGDPDAPETDPAVSGRFHFVQLSEPSSEVIFPEARQMPGDTEANSIWKFLQRTAASFLNSHGFRIGIDNKIGARVLSDTNDKNEEARLNKKKKWQVIIPLAILGKLIHLKMLLTQILVGLGAIKVILIGGGVLLYYYLKHHTLCKIEPHLIQSHSHVSDVPISSEHSSYEYPAYSASSPYGSASYGSYSKGWDRTYNRHFNIADEINH